MKSVVLVTVDSLRADHCGFMGHDRETTPTLDGMAERGLSFENAISPGPSTPESMPVVLTGEHPVELNDSAGSLLASRRKRIRHHMQARETLAERFSRKGYTTGAFTPNPYTARYFGFDEGFDRFEDFMDGSRARLYQGLLDGVLGETSKSSVLPVRLLMNWVKREEVFKPWEAFYDDLLSWVNETEGPYFLWVLLMDTHDPYLVPGEYRTQSRRAMYHANWRLWRQGHAPPFTEKTHERLVRAYDDSIRYADAFLDRLQQDLDDDSLVVVHGDHGEAFGEHGTYGHHAQLYEENIHVPLVVDGAPDRSVEQPFSLRNLPEVLVPLATEERLPELPAPPATARTLDEDRLAFRGTRWKYLQQNSDGQVYQLPSEELATSGEIRRIESLYRQFSERTVEAEREASRIARGAAAVVEEGSL